MVVYRTVGDDPAFLREDEVVLCCREAFEHGDEMTDEDVLKDALKRGVVQMVEVEGMEDDD